VGRRTQEEEQKILRGWDSLEKAVVEGEVLLRDDAASRVELRRALQKVVTFYGLERQK